MQGYFAQLPEAVKKVEVEVEERGEDGRVRTVTRVDKLCICTPHSTHSTTATLLLSDGVDIRLVQELLDHQRVTTTQICDNRRGRTSEGASHFLQM